MIGDFPFGLSSSNEETVTLADKSGAQVDQVIFAGANAGVAYCRLPDGDGAWQMCDSTLGGSNIAASMVCGNGALEGSEQCEGAELGDATCMSLGYTGGTLACTAACAYETGMCTSISPIIINELESTEDQIEIFNSSDMDIDISGWILTDEPTGPGYDPNTDTEKLLWPAMSILPAGTYLIVGKGEAPGQHPFGLGAGGDTVTLLQADLTFVDQVTYGPSSPPCPTAASPTAPATRGPPTASPPSAPPTTSPDRDHSMRRHAPGG
jgi:hypothetical protein